MGWGVPCRQQKHRGQSEYPLLHQSWWNIYNRRKFVIAKDVAAAGNTGHCVAGGGGGGGRMCVSHRCCASLSISKSVCVSENSGGHSRYSLC